jgi:hypothetical protein
MFTSTSRYANLETATYQTVDGRMIAYMRRRFIPVFQGTVLLEHEIKQRDRPDTITAKHLGDPEQFWRICDANAVMKPEDLTAENGRRVIIPLPAGG